MLVSNAILNAKAAEILSLCRAKGMLLTLAVYDRHHQAKNTKEVVGGHIERIVLATRTMSHIYVVLM